MTWKVSVCIRRLLAARMDQRLTFSLAAAQECMNNFFLTCKNRSLYIFKLHQIVRVREAVK